MIFKKQHKNHIKTQIPVQFSPIYTQIPVQTDTVIKIRDKNTVIAINENQKK